MLPEGAWYTEAPTVKLTYVPNNELDPPPNPSDDPPFRYAIDKSAQKNCDESDDVITVCTVPATDIELLGSGTHRIGATGVDEFGFELARSAYMKKAKTFQTELGLTEGQVWLLIAIPVILGSIGRLPMGMLADRFGGRIVFGLLLVFIALPAIMLSFAHTYQAHLLWGLLLGMAGTSFSVGVALVSKSASFGHLSKCSRIPISPGSSLPEMFV